MDLASVLVGFGAGVVLAAFAAFVRRGARSAAPSQEQTLPVAFVAEHIPVAVLLYTSGGSIRFANRPAEELLFAGTSAVGKNFLQLLALAPTEVRDALLGTAEAVFTLDHEGELETFQMLRREVMLEGEVHFLLLINTLTREVGRREIAVLKNVIRVISHELNNSLASMTSLIGSARFIVNAPQNLPKLDRVIDGLEERTNHLHHFLSEYAVLSRLPSPRQREVSLALLTERLAEMFPKVTFESPKVDQAWFDETQIEQALINLLKNANEAEGPAQDVQLVFRERPAALEIGVFDRGRGFSAEALQHGLLPFFSTKPGGSGVGLALCREVAEGHNGSLRIKKREGGGSAVYLTLPYRAQSKGQGTSIALTLTRT